MPRSVLLNTQLLITTFRMSPLFSLRQGIRRKVKTNRQARSQRLSFSAKEIAFFDKPIIKTANEE